MEKKAKIGSSALWIVGLVYTILGSIFLVLGIMLGVVLRREEVWFLGLIFGSIGAVFLILGVIFLAVELRKKKRANALLQANRYVWGDVVDTEINYNVTLNGRHPRRVVAQYRDGSGNCHIFRSPNLRLSAGQELIGKKVRIYYEDTTFRHYYVDAEALLGNYIEH